jgi:membrane protease YdiL (CAAX protease family)
VSSRGPIEGQGRREGARRALALSGLVTVVSAGAVAFAFQPAHAGTAAMLIALGAVYALFSAVAIARLRRRGELYRVMRPAAGDLTLGAATACVLYVAAMAGQRAIAAHGTPREAWIASIYHLLGDPTETAYHVTSAAIFVVAALEELTFRGLVMRSLDEWLGARAAWIVSTALYALAHLPTAFLLADPVAGPNPLLVGAALGAGFVWGYIANRKGRLPPAMFAHAMFTWAVVEFPLWRP